MLKICVQDKKLQRRKETRLFPPDEAISPVGKSRVSLALIFFVLYTG
ncbi:Uncharacterized protein dnm_059860 [Desulfonema magnum]|uniref:Uncharacterized protein n=1 Tax=Desulfonema magnum TaxID=45655 RepID=A0A975BR65_9BACT|nr:Uncharacterized protein dnm_059860 [Desulfonema magnum]